MFLRSKISVLGLYTADNTLFDNLVLPDGVDKDTLIAEIISECADLEVLYPDSDYMKMLIGYWSGGMLDNWQKMFDALGQNYDPLNTSWLLRGGLDFPSGCRLVRGSALIPQQLCRFATPKLALWIRTLKDGGKPDEHTSASMETSKEEWPAEDLLMLSRFSHVQLCVTP